MHSFFLSLSLSLLLPTHSIHLSFVLHLTSTGSGNSNNNSSNWCWVNRPVNTDFRQVDRECWSKPTSIHLRFHLQSQHFAGTISYRHHHHFQRLLSCRCLFHKPHRCIDSLKMDFLNRHPINSFWLSIIIEKPIHAIRCPHEQHTSCLPSFSSSPPFVHSFIDRDSDKSENNRFCYHVFADLVVFFFFCSFCT